MCGWLLLRFLSRLDVTILEQKVLWTPSKLIARLGKEINDKSSYLYWAYKASSHSSFCLIFLVVKYWYSFLDYAFMTFWLRILL